MSGLFLVLSPVVGVAASWVWAFRHRPPRAVRRPQEQPARAREGSPGRQRQAADLGLSWATVMAVELYLEQPPSHELNHQFAEGLGVAVDRHRELVAQNSSGRAPAGGIQ